MKLGIKTLTLNLKNAALLSSVDQPYSSGDKLPVCHSCYGTLSKTKLPGWSHFNNLDPGRAPTVVTVLNEIELSLVSRTKPYMRIHKLKNKFDEFRKKCFR